MGLLRVVSRLLALAICLASPVAAVAQSDSTFVISRELLSRLLQAPTLRLALSVDVDTVGPVHDVAHDCEAHVAGRLSDDSLAAPHATVLEPPNLCDAPVPGGWRARLQRGFGHRTCEAAGFPRVYMEHWHGSLGATNPQHMLELHPLLSLECGDSAIDFRPFLRALPGMSQIKGENVADCLANIHLRARRVDAGYEFAQQGQTSRCGNFGVVSLQIDSSTIEQLDGGHRVSAIARPCGFGPVQTHIFTFEGTPEDSVLTDIAAGTTPVRGFYLHTMLTYDFVSLLDAVRTPGGNWRNNRVRWGDVETPVALVSFGETADQCRP